MSWSVEFLDEKVEAEIAALPADMQARFLRIVELVEDMGLSAVGKPHIRHLEGKLWEMRMKGRSGIARAIYVTAQGSRVIVLHGFVKKSQKTPRRTLELARRRAQEVK